MRSMIFSASLRDEVSTRLVAGEAGPQLVQVESVQAGRVVGEGDLVAGIPNLHVAAVSVGGGEEKSRCFGRVPLEHAADRVEIGRGQGWQASTVQVFESMPKCGRVDLTVYSWRGDDELAGQFAAETCGEGELVRKGAAQSRVLARGEGVAPYIDDREGICAELGSCCGDLLGHADRAGGRVEKQQMTRKVPSEAW